MSDIIDKAARAGAETISRTTEAAKFDGNSVMRVWQDNANKMLRANERMMQGMLAALKLEFQLGQDLLDHRMDTIKAARQADKPAEIGQTVMERHLHEMERLVASMREISEEMRKSFGDATKLLLDDQNHPITAKPNPLAEAGGIVG